MSINPIINIKKFHANLQLTENQKHIINNALEKLIDSRKNIDHSYFEGFCEGCNSIRKLIDEIDDDYNTHPGS